MVQPLSRPSGVASGASTERERLHRLGGLLARWHCWRKHYSTERSYARQGGPSDPDDELEQLLMHAIEDEVGQLPMPWQRLVQQVARAECLGVEMDETTSCHHAAVLDRLAWRLRSAGVL